MEKYNDEQTKVTAQAEQDIVQEEKKGALDTEVSLGKFKDVNALLEAYNNLESEFTKRCQKVKELEAKLTVVDKEKSPTETDLSKSQELSSEEKDDVLKNYLREVLSKKQRAIVLDGAGIGVKTPAEKPKTLEQAGILAKDLLNKHL